MAVRYIHEDLDRQLDLFTAPRPKHDTVDSVRPDGRTTLAGAPSEDGPRIGTEGTSASDAPGGGGKDEGRNGNVANTVDEAGSDGPTSSRPGLGNGEGEIHSAPARVLADGHHAESKHANRRRRHQEEPPRNLNSYRIAEADHLGEGGPKQKFQLNLKAIRQLRTLEVEARAATD